ncbi:MAG: holin [Lachnospiraceae bacterium]|nr:holin [Lachnospiraceae bacterium]
MKRNISKGTLIRLVLAVIVVINMFLKAIGKPIIDADEGSVEAIIELGVSAAVLVLSYWKNNSFSKNAIEADKYLKILNKWDSQGE